MPRVRCVCMLGASGAAPVSFVVSDMTKNAYMFVALPQVRLWHDLHTHLQRLQGVNISGFLTDGVIGSWIDFSYRGHAFTINEQSGEYQFFVDDPACPDEVLSEVTRQCKAFLRL